MNNTRLAVVGQEPTLAIFLSVFFLRNLNSDVLF